MLINFIAMLFKQKVKYLLFVFMVFFSAFSFANQPDTVTDCITVNDDVNQIVQLIENGSYRDHTLSKEEELPYFSFEPQQSYQQYLDYAGKLIELKNPRAKAKCLIYTPMYQLLAQQNHWQGTPTVSQLIAPFELKAKQQVNNDAVEVSKGILLIHGLTDSPFIFHDLAVFFHQQGFTVRTLLLPGHGTVVTDLVDISMQQWQQAADFAIKRMIKDFDQVYLGGYSTGGALIFDNLMQQTLVSQKIKGLLMWSPASKAKSKLSWLAKYIDMLPFVDWITLDADIDFAKYESFPFNAGAQTHALMSRIIGDEALKNRTMHNIPLFVVVSGADQTIDAEFTLRLINEWQQAVMPLSAKNNVLIYYSENNDVTNNLANSVTIDSKIEAELKQHTKIIIPSCTQKSCQQVINIAHIAVTNSPDNLHYGVSGRYRNCGHYLSDIKSYQQCKSANNVRLGEITSKNLQSDLPLKRLTFNPYFKNMLTELRLFIENTTPKNN